VTTSPVISTPVTTRPTAIDPETGPPTGFAAIEGSRPTDFLANSVVIAGRVLKHFIRSPVMVIATFGFPVLQLFMLLAAFQILVRDSVDESYVARLAPLIVLITAFSSILSSAIGFWADIRSGVFTRFRTMPINSMSVLTGRILGDLTRIMLVAVLVVVIAYLPGFRFERGPGSAVAFFALVAVFGVMCTSLSIVVALTAAHPGIIVRWVHLPTLALTLMSSGYVPLAVFPGPVQPFVAANPMSLVSQALIGLSSGGPLVVPILGTLAWTLGVSAVCAVLIARRFRSFVAG
jgi:ABC-2 type transport system permease protein